MISLLCPAALGAPRVVALLSAALFLGSCGGGADPNRNVLLVTIDTLRADRLGGQGYERETTPNLDALAAQGVRFARAYAHAPFTAPSHASLFTSLVTQSHGVFTWGRVLDPTLPSFFKTFGEQGYRTAAFYNHPALASSELTAGADEVQLRYYEPAPDTIRAFLTWAESEEKPFAAWVHLWDVHRPYGYRSWGAAHLREQVQRSSFVFGEDSFGSGDPIVGRSEHFYNLNVSKRGRTAMTGRGPRKLDERDYEWIADRYDAGVRYVDECMGQLAEDLTAAGLLERTLVVVTSDHGESLRERESCYFTHDPFLYEETLRVPLILRFPAAAEDLAGSPIAGTVVPDLVRGIDVFPTLLEFAGLPLPAGLQGRSLLPLARGETLAPATLLAQTQTRKANERSETAEEAVLEFRQALLSGQTKLVHDLELDTYQLYDLASDPGERNDLAGDPAHAELFARMKRELDSLRQSLPLARGEDGELTDEDRTLLGAAGYLGNDSEE